MNVILSYRKSPLKNQLDRCGGMKIIVKKVDLCEFLLSVKMLGFNEVLYYKWMDNENTWKELWEDTVPLLKLLIELKLINPEKIKARGKEL